jgi:hypothetical protein
MYYLNLLRMKKSIFLIVILAGIFASLNFSVNAQTVLVSKSGKYHKEGAKCIVNAKVTKMEKADAIAKGYKACKACFPEEAKLNPAHQTNKVKGAERTKGDADKIKVNDKLKGEVDKSKVDDKLKTDAKTEKSAASAKTKTIEK